jgi:hypothetical protein
MKSARESPNRITRKMVNDALRMRGRDESLREGDGYFYFGGGEAVNWLTSSVMVRRISDLTLEQWLKEFESLLKRNEKLEQMERQTPAKKKTRTGSRRRDGE